MASEDLGLFRNGLHVLADAQDSGRVVKGPEKVAQRFTMHLMTRAGSRPGSTLGSDFVTRLVTNRITSELDVFSTLASSLTTVVKNMRAEETSDDLDDEKLAGVKIEKLVIETSNLLLNLRLRMQSGDKTGITIPLTFLLS